MGSCFSNPLLQASVSTPYHSFEGKVYQSVCVSIYDGDSCTLAINLSSKVLLFKCRLAGIDTPEIKSKSQGAYAARDYLINALTTKEMVNTYPTKGEIQQHLHNHKRLLRVECGKFDKYGRLLVKIFVEPDTCSVNDKLIVEGLAKSYDGGTKEVW